MENAGNLDLLLMNMKWNEWNVSNVGFYRFKFNFTTLAAMHHLPLMIPLCILIKLRCIIMFVFEKFNEVRFKIKL